MDQKPAGPVLPSSGKACEFAFALRYAPMPVPAWPLLPVYPKPLPGLLPKSLSPLKAICKPPEKKFGFLVHAFIHDPGNVLVAFDRTFSLCRG